MDDPSSLPGKAVLSAPPGSKISRFRKDSHRKPLHGLKLVLKEEALPMKEQPEFPVLALLASRGLLAPDTWKCKQAQVSLKAIDVPPGCTRCPRPTGQTADAGTIIEQMTFAVQ